MAAVKAFDPAACAGSSPERRRDDALLIDRAKQLLMSCLGMSEAQAHRYIEKCAMDGCVKRREIAVRIILTYDD